mgnify:CR=1 FL=1
MFPPFNRKVNNARAFRPLRCLFMAFPLFALVFTLIALATKKGVATDLYSLAGDDGFIGALASKTSNEIRVLCADEERAEKCRAAFPFRESPDPSQLLDFFQDFYPDFRRDRAEDMLARLNIPMDRKIRQMSKGTREKVQLILVMSRKAKLYLLDEPIGGVDPATRDYILDTIIRNYSEDASVVISTHLIADVENVLDDVIFLREGQVSLQASVDDIREQYGKSVDALFREVFRC